MTEINDDPTAITLARSHELAESQAQPRVMPLERRDFNAMAAALSASASGPASAPAADSGAAAETGARIEVPPPAADPADAGAAFRQTRLAVTAGLVVLLVLAWIWQRRSGLRR